MNGGDVYAAMPFTFLIRDLAPPMLLTEARKDRGKKRTMSGGKSSH